MSVLTSADTRPRLNWHPLVYEGEKNALIIYAMNSDAHTIPLGGKKNKKSPMGQGRNKKDSTSQMRLQYVVFGVWLPIHNINRKIECDKA